MSLRGSEWGSDFKITHAETAILGKNTRKKIVLNYKMRINRTTVKNINKYNVNSASLLTKWL